MANSRKQIRHKPKSRRKKRLRPQRQHRLTLRVMNFGVFLDFAIWFSVAILLFFGRGEREPETLEECQPFGMILGGGRDRYL